MNWFWCYILAEISFRIKVRVGDKEIELEGQKEDVLKTLDDIEDILNKITDAFKAESKSTEVSQDHSQIEHFPNIPRTSQCSEAVTSLLETDWGKTPRAIGELREAMEANAIFFPKTTLSGVLVWMTKKGTLRRWKDKKRGYLYVMGYREEIDAKTQS
jgi:hypothetical protein